MSQGTGENEHMEKRLPGSLKDFKLHSTANALGSWSSPGQELEAGLLTAVILRELSVERRGVFDA